MPAIAHSSHVALQQYAAVLLSSFIGVALATGMLLAQDLPVEKVLPRELAVEAAMGALAACEQQGYRVTVAVVDRAGLLRTLIRGDGAPPHTVDSSRRKAYTSASLRRPTLELAQMLSENPGTAGLRDINDNILLLGGGLPIKAGDQVIGGIGVGGAPGGDKDEACAQAGIDRIGPNLK